MSGLSVKSVELFAGIGGFRLACDRLGINTVWANDLAPKACQVYVSAFGSDKFFGGDIKQLIDTIPHHDLLTAGFPCQPFSSAGKKLGICDPRGTLFEVIVKIIEQQRPKYFVLENVKRILTMEEGYHFATILDSLASVGYFLEWRILNALNFGLPQNRERLFIIGHLKTDAVHPYLAPQNDLSSLSDRVLEKIMNLDTWDSIISQNKKFKSWGLSYQGKFIDAHLDVFSERIKIKKLKDILEDEVREIFDFTTDTIERIKNSIKVDRFYNGVQILYNQKGGARMGYTIFGIEGLAPTLTSTTSRHYERYKVGDKYRRLTNVEYARIQGFPDNHCRSVSIYDQYALYGNAIPPIMAEWVLKRLINEQSTPLKNCQKQLSLF